MAFIDSSKINKRNVSSKLSKFDAIIIPGGFGEANTSGMIDSIEYARVNKIPFLGICLGMQLACIEYARNVLNIKDATSQEFNKKAKNKIIHLIEGKNDNKNLGGTLRLGNYECYIDDKNSLAYKIYQSNNIIERHRHRYEFNNQYE
ncbi:CTP synthase, partial [bacterium]|nr:CTP synthase [bacterium]